MKAILRGGPRKYEGMILNNDYTGVLYIDMDVHWQGHWWNTIENEGEYRVFRYKSVPQERIKYYSWWNRTKRRLRISK